MRRRKKKPGVGGRKQASAAFDMISVMLEVIDETRPVGTRSVVQAYAHHASRVLPLAPAFLAQARGLCWRGGDMDPCVGEGGRKGQNGLAAGCTI